MTTINKNIIVLFIGIAYSVVLNAQVEINTKNVTGVFQIDSKGDTDVSGSTGITDDVIVTADGNMALGATSPTTKLEIQSAGSAIRITDGSQDATKVLTSDENGLASWKYPFMYIEEQQFTNKTNGIADIPLITGSTYYQSGLYIDLPPGEWVIHVCYDLNVSGTIGSKGLWVRSGFTENAGNVDDSGLLPVGAALGYVGKKQLVSRSLLGTSLMGKMYFQLLGSVKVQNTTPSIKRIYYVIGNADAYGDAATTGSFINIGKYVNSVTARNLTAVPIVEVSYDILM